MCIGCGCTDDRACHGGCSWVRLDFDRCIGVCSSCWRDMARWDAGDRTISAKAHESRKSRCKCCRAPIIWFRTNGGRNMPVDAATVQQNDAVFDATRHTSHFATCQYATKYRRAR